MVISNNFEQVLKVGSKGEIFPPKEIREYLGLTSDQTIIVSVVNNKLIIRKVYSFQEILERPAKVKISREAWKQLKKEENEALNL